MSSGGTSSTETTLERFVSFCLNGLGRWSYCCCCCSSFSVEQDHGRMRYSDDCGARLLGSPSRPGGLSAVLSQDEDDVCPTCLDEYDEENPRYMTACGHHFHIQCMYEWMERSQTCPVCSQVLSFKDLID